VLTELLKAKVKFVWSFACQQAFDSIKSLLCSSPVLAAPCFDKNLMLQVDARQVGAGAVLLQEDDQGVVRPVSFFSKRFNHYQFNYSVIEKEALALFRRFLGTAAFSCVHRRCTTHCIHRP